MVRFVSESLTLVSVLAGGNDSYTTPSPCADAPTGWKAILGGLTEIQVDDTQVCGLNSFDENKVYCNTKKHPIHWWNIPSASFTSLALRNGYLYGIQSSGQLVVGSTGPTSTFQAVPTSFGQVKSVAYDGTTVCAVSKLNRLYCAKAASSPNLSWLPLDGSVTQVAIAGSTVYGVNSQNMLWVGSVSDASCASGAAKWAHVPNVLLKQVSYDGSRLCGVSPSSEVICADVIAGSNTLQWTTLKGELAQVSVYGSSLYGVDAAAHIFYQDMATTTTVPTTSPVTTSSKPPLANPYPNWAIVPTSKLKLVTVASFGSLVCGTEVDGDIFCATYDQFKPLNWIKITGGLQQLALCGGGLFGVNKQGQILYTSSIGSTSTPTWVLLWGNLVNVDFDGTQLCGVNNINQVYCAWRDVHTTPNWTLLDGKLKQIVVVKGQLFGLDTSNKLVAGDTKKLSTGCRSASWKDISNAPKFSRIAYDGIRLCGLTMSTSTIKCADSGLTTSPNWYDVPGGNIAYLSVEKEHLFALTSDSTLLHRTLDIGEVHCL